MSRYNIKDVNKILEQYEVKVAQLTRENIFLNAALNEQQEELNKYKSKETEKEVSE